MEHWVGPPFRGDLEYIVGGYTNVCRFISAWDSVCSLSEYREGGYTGCFWDCSIYYKRGNIGSGVLADMGGVKVI